MLRERRLEYCFLLWSQASVWEKSSAKFKIVFSGCKRGYHHCLFTQAYSVIVQESTQGSIFVGYCLSFNVRNPFALLECLAQDANASANSNAFLWIAGNCGISCLSKMWVEQEGIQDCSFKLHFDWDAGFAYLLKSIKWRLYSCSLGWCQCAI